MSIKHLLITALISIAIIITDYKLNLFSYIKLATSFIAVPVNIVVNLPYTIYSLTKPKEIVTDNNKELLLLRAQMQNFNNLLLENQRLLNLVGNNYVVDNDDLIITRIMNINKSRLRKNITINHGSKSGVKVSNFVIGELGVIGLVSDVSSTYSVVRLITDPLQYIPIINSRSGEKAIAKGFAVNDDRLIINFVRTDADVKLGDIFVTSGEGSLFVKGYHVGKVIDINQNDQNFLNIILKPFQEIDKTIFAIVDKN